MAPRSREPRDPWTAPTVPKGGPIEGSASPGQDPIRVLIIDDHAALAGAMAIAIDGYPDLVCVGTAGTLDVATSRVAELKPDVVLVDVYLPDGNGIDAIPGIIAAHPGVRVLVLTGHTDVDLLSRAAAQGASGFLPKESSVSAVIGAIRAAVAGQMLVDGATLASILGRLADTSRRAHGSGDGKALTRREADVIRLMGQGLDPHAIARALGISLNTCRGYQKTLLAKLGAHSQLEAVVIATRKGLIPR